MINRFLCKDDPNISKLWNKLDQARWILTSFKLLLKFSQSLSEHFQDSSRFHCYKGLAQCIFNIFILSSHDFPHSDSGPRVPWLMENAKDLFQGISQNIQLLECNFLHCNTIFRDGSISILIICWNWELDWAFSWPTTVLS